MAQEPVRYVKKGLPDRLAYSADERVAAEWDGFIAESNEQRATREAKEQEVAKEAAKAEGVDKDADKGGKSK